MVSTRFPPRLSVDDAAEIALRAPRIAREIANGCSTLISSGSGRSDELYFGLISTCPNKQVPDGVILSVNVETGALTDPKKLNDLGSEDTRRLGNALLEKVRRRLDSAKTEIAQTCRVN